MRCRSVSLTAGIVGVIGSPERVPDAQISKHLLF